MDRLAMLQKMVAAGAKDPFVHYGLAMEYRRLEKFDDSSQAFRDLFERFADYLPAYLMAGGVEASSHRKDEAASLFRAGIELARKQGNQNTLGELEAALNDLDLDEG
jgi:predicted Zn-dependent protease